MKKHQMALNCLRVTVVVLVLNGAAICRIQQSRPPVVIKGKVSMFYDKTALRSVWVILSQDGKEISRTLTGDDGRYYIKVFSGGTYDVSVRRGKSDLCKREVDLPAYLQTDHYELNIRIKSLSVLKTRKQRCE